MRKFIGTIAVLLLVVAGCAAIAGSSSSGHKAKVDVGSHSAAAAVGTPQPSSPAPKAKPDASYTPSCDYLLGNFTNHTSHGFRFVARAHIKNTGNVGVRLRVTASWIQVGRAAIKRTTKLYLPFDHNVTINKTVEVDQDNIDAIQAFTGLNDCHVKVVIIGTEGAVQS